MLHISLKAVMFLLIFVNLLPLLTVSFKESCLMISWFGWILNNTLKVQTYPVCLFLIYHPLISIALILLNSPHKAFQISFTTRRPLDAHLPVKVCTHFQAQLGYICICIWGGRSQKIYRDCATMHILFNINILLICLQKPGIVQHLSLKLQIPFLEQTRSHDQSQFLIKHT